jgi:hypothetical protein
MAKHLAIFLDSEGTNIIDNGYLKNLLGIEFYPNF